MTDSLLSSLMDCLLTIFVSLYNKSFYLLLALSRSHVSGAPPEVVLLFCLHIKPVVSSVAALLHKYQPPRRFLLHKFSPLHNAMIPHNACASGRLYYIVCYIRMKRKNLGKMIAGDRSRPQARHDLWALDGYWYTFILNGSEAFTE